MNRVELEVRRLAAVQDLKAPISCGILAREYGVSRTTIVRWRRALASGSTLERRPAPGRPRRLTRDQESVLKRLWLLGPIMLLDADTDKWTQDRFTELVRRYMGVGYSGDHIGRIMHRLGLTVPRHHAMKRTRRAGGPVCT